MRDEELLVENEKKRNELVSAYKRLFMTDDGKKVLSDLERFCGFKTSSVCEMSPDPNQTIYCEGKRRVFLRINSMIEKESIENE